MYGRTYVILYYDPRVFCVRSAFDPVPNCTTESSGLSISTRITLEVELFTVLNSFAGAKLKGLPFLFELSGGGKSMRSLSWL